VVGIVIVFPFAVDQLAEPAGSINLPHRVQVVVEGGGLEHRVVRPEFFLTAANSFSASSISPGSGNGGGRVFAVVENIDAVRA